VLKKSLCAVFIIGLAGCSNGAPSEDQVKKALYDYYGTTSASDELKQSLATEVSVKGCKKEDAGYRCEIENKELNTSIGMMFALDKSDGQWKFVKESS
jgi:hypothetical protein